MFAFLSEDLHMKKFVTFIAVSLCAIAVLLAGCAQVKSNTLVDQRLGAELSAGVGDAVYSSTSKKNLPNAFGNADVFGRTTPSGMTNVLYYGVKDGMAIFIRKTIDIDSGATTMNSTPVVVNNSSRTTHQGTIGSTRYDGTSVTTGPSYVIMPDTPEAQYYSRGAIQFNVPIAELPKALLVEGYLVTILSADSVSVNYKIEINESK